MPKKPVRNAFYFYMKELEPQLRREGRVFPNGMADVVPIAHPRWKDLPQKEKERFENMSKKNKAQMRGIAGDQYRLDSVGKIIAHRKDPHTELEKRRLQEKKHIIKNWPPGKAVKSEKFYFINFQYLCKVEDKLEVIDYLPCEIAMIEFCIEKGITKKLHRFIEPGLIPQGYKFLCMQNSENTHQIPMENFALADSNYRGLWIQMENFINPGGDKPENPPLYCLGVGEFTESVEFCLNWIHGHACLGEPNRIRKVYEVESLFMELHAHIGNQLSKTQLIDSLTSSDWDYEKDTKCDYHEEKECKFCALGIVNRYAYAISDSLCKPFGVQLTKNHLPMRASAGAFTVLSPSSMPVCNKQESRLPPKGAPMFQQPTHQARKPPVRQPVPEEDYQELRRPNIPGVSNETGYSMGRGTAQPSSWGGAYGEGGPSMAGMGRGLIGGGPNVAAMGRGLTSLQNLSLNDKHTGMTAPPKPAQVPAWQMPSQPSGIGRGLSMSGNVAPTMGADEDDDDDLPPLRMPGRAAPEVTALRHPVQPELDYPALGPSSQPSPVYSNDPEPYSQFDDVAEDIRHPSGGDSFVSCVGRGQGGILSHLMTNKVKSGVPCGRGYTPPGWVDDGSIGPIRKP